MSGTFMDKSFCTYAPGDDTYRDNWERTFKKGKPEPVVEPELSCPKCGGPAYVACVRRCKEVIAEKVAESVKESYVVELCTKHHLPLEPGTCPYSEEINNCTEECNCCDHCRQDCADDI